MESEERITELEGQNATLTIERDGLQTKLTESEKAKAIAETKARVDEAVSKSELPEPAKTRILERFKDTESGEGLEDAIKSEKDYVASLLEAGKVKGMGEHTPSKADKEALRESWKRMHPEYTEEQLEVVISGR